MIDLHFFNRNHFMKRLSLSGLLLLIFYTACSQKNTIANGITFGGYIRDALSGLPLEKATIRLTGMAKPSVKSETVSDSTGLFIFYHLPAGKYQLSSAFVSYKVFSQTVQLNDSVQFPESTDTIRMTSESKSLQTVIITISGSRQRPRGSPPSSPRAIQVPPDAMPPERQAL